jgi:serine/threonine-protein kinase
MVMPWTTGRMHGSASRRPLAVGNYEVVEPLAAGGMGQVWRGRHRRLGRDAAIKLMRAGRDDQDAFARFEAEMRVTAALNSPHVVRVFDCGTTAQGDLFYAMELLRGSDLEALVRRFGPLSADRAIDLLSQVCDAIGELHQQGFIHGDVKPANLYTCRMGLQYDFAKVLDFGLARPARRRVCGTRPDAAPVTLGTPAYMAPETIRGIDGVDQRADVYALGCVAYFLVTGRLVFEADTPAELLWRHVHSEPEPPSARTECVIPRHLDDIVLACLRKDPARRPKDASELRRHIASVRGSWTQLAAKRWWEAHLPEFSDPLTDDGRWAVEKDRLYESTSIESHGTSPCRSSDVLVEWAV